MSHERFQIRADAASRSRLRIRHLLLLGALLVPATTFASVTTQPGLPIYTYLLTLPTISGGQEVDTSTFQFEFSWVGPLRFNSPPNSLPPNCCTPMGTPKSGYSFAGVAFTASGTDSEVILDYSDFSGPTFATSNTATFTFIEPDSFWATPGVQTFDVDNGSGVGASFVTGGIDPGCADCQVSTTVATPEPGYFALMAAGLIGLAALYRRRARAASASR